MCRFTRRCFLSLLGLPALPLRAAAQLSESSGQMASRNVRAAPRAKPSGLPFHSHLTDVAASAGLQYSVISGHRNRADYVIEAMGCGAAFLDFDNDGWLDVLVLSSSRFGDPPAQSSNRLYKNNRNGTFTDVTEKAGLLHHGYCYGVTVGDYNNDGWEDIFITGWPHNLLYRNNGDGAFTDVTQQAGLLSDDSQFGSGCTFLDYDRDGHLDLFVSHYVGFDQAIPRASDKNGCNGVFCGPRGLPYGRHALYKNCGDGTFRDVSAPSGIATPARGYGLTAIAADFDDDGWPDIYLACDSTPSLLFLNQHNGTFLEQAMERGVALSEDGMEQAGMGVAVGDLFESGRLDILKTHYAGDTPAVYANVGQGQFEDRTLRSGLAVENRFTSWGVGVEDLDNDGNPDIFWVTGGVYPEQQNGPAQLYRTPRVLFRNLGHGRWEELSAGTGAAVSAPHCSRGCAFGDFDNDGDVDILIVNQNEPPSLLRNDVSATNHWIKVKLTGSQSNRSAIGARVTVSYGAKVQAKEVLAQSSYLSVNDRRLHFGLGPVSKVDLQVRWPLGSTERFKNVAADKLVHVTEGQGITRLEDFTRL